MPAWLTTDVFAFALRVVAFSLVLLVHWAVARRLYGDPTVARILRWMAPFPPFTPFVAMAVKQRAAAMFWLFVVTLYVVVRVVT